MVKGVVIYLSLQFSILNNWPNFSGESLVFVLKSQI